MTDGRGKQPSKNKPSKGTSKDMRKAGRGAKPGPKPKDVVDTPFRIKATSWTPSAASVMTGAQDASTDVDWSVMDMGIAREYVPCACSCGCSVLVPKDQVMCTRCASH